MKSIGFDPPVFIYKNPGSGELSPESWRVKKVPKIAIAIFGKFLYTR